MNILNEFIVFLCANLVAPYFSYVYLLVVFQALAKCSVTASYIHSLVLRRGEYEIKLAN